MGYTLKIRISEKQKQMFGIRAEGVGLNLSAWARYILVGTCEESPKRRRGVKYEKAQKTLALCPTTPTATEQNAPPEEATRTPIPPLGRPMPARNSQYEPPDPQPGDTPPQNDARLRHWADQQPNPELARNIAEVRSQEYRARWKPPSPENHPA